MRERERAGRKRTHQRCIDSGDETHTNTYIYTHTSMQYKYNQRRTHAGGTTRPRDTNRNEIRLNIKED